MIDYDIIYLIVHQLEHRGLSRKRNKTRHNNNSIRYWVKSRLLQHFAKVEGIARAARGFLKTNIEEKGDSAALIEIESIFQNYFEKLEQHN